MHDARANNQRASSNGLMEKGLRPGQANESSSAPHRAAMASVTGASFPPWRLTANHLCFFQLDHVIPSLIKTISFFRFRFGFGFFKSPWQNELRAMGSAGGLGSSFDLAKRLIPVGAEIPRDSPSNICPSPQQHTHTRAVLTLV